MDLQGRSLKSQMRYADKIGAQYVVVLGENELQERKAELKRLSDGNTEPVTLDKLADKLG